LHHLEPELAREIVSEARRAHFRDRRPARGDDQRGRGRLGSSIGDAELPVAVHHIADRLAALQIDAALAAFVEQHGHDLLRAIVAE